MLVDLQHHQDLRRPSAHLWAASAWLKVIGADSPFPPRFAISETMPLPALTEVLI
jgi:hypothetical protein